MARQSLFWGKAKGKLGEVVLYRAGGEQRSRTYVKDVKNPKSAAQMAQRIKMASVLGFFRAAKEVIRYSFPQRPVSQSGFNAYAKATLPVANTAISRNLADEGLSVPLNYQVSQGTLMLVPQGLRAVAAADGNAEGSYKGGILLSPLTGPISGGTINSSTSAMAPILDYELQQAGVIMPDKYNITVVVSTYADEGFVTKTRTFAVDKTSGTTVISGQVADEEGIFFMATVADSEGVERLAFAVADSASAGNGAYLAAVVFSYTDVNGKLQVNSDYMKFVAGDMELIEQFQPNGVVYEQYLEDLGVGSSDILSTR